ncbi:D-arabinitol 2-dehydrogenase-2 [Elsinoe australis]|uniref:D-arabinitol 2-dehydrogenase-2 n=1 Tax=Elsinoe australis TaxID=40998 RepID=A0A4V6DTD3_9PEZI|nr:D-arabinitol 2-dehydrogenase-2 [Elsinoe australis]
MSPALIDAQSSSSSEHLPINGQTQHTNSGEREGPAMFSLTGKTVLVTGGARGLGVTLATAVIQAGGHVACVDILPQPSDEEWTVLQKLTKKSSTNASYYQCDITSETELQGVMEKVQEEATNNGSTFYGVVACAGIQQKIPAIDYPAADFERILRVNTLGTFLTVKHAAKQMIKNGVQGSIVMIASMSGDIANRGLTCTAYNSSKAAVQQMCRSLSVEWGRYGIRVNTLSPGYIRTAMTDALLEDEPHLKDLWMGGALLGRLGVPEDFKAPTLFLLSPGNTFMTGADLRVDGGHCASA